MLLTFQSTNSKNDVTVHQNRKTLLRGMTPDTSAVQSWFCSTCAPGSKADILCRTTWQRRSAIPRCSARGQPAQPLAGTTPSVSGSRVQGCDFSSKSPGLCCSARLCSPLRGGVQLSNFVGFVLGKKIKFRVHNST